MHPIFFELGGLSIRWYGVMAAIGFLLASFVVNAWRRHAGMTQDQAMSLMLVGIVAGIVGARLFYVIQFFPQFRGNWLAVFRVDQGGLVFYGGFFLALASLIVYARRQKLDIWRVLDVIAPALAIGHAAGRIGCFLNGCCYGKPTEAVFGVHYPAGSEVVRRYGELAVHPVQLYEVAANLAIFALMLFLLKRGRRGVPTGAYVLLYGIVRFGDEFFRGDHRQFVSGLTPAQVIGLFMVPLGIALLVYFQRQKSTAPAAAAESTNHESAPAGGKRKCRKKH
jgi:phosphatidylglycerol:prolipoprotein diacylglycerol transferase